MAKKKELRRKLLGSTKTGRLVRAASLAGVLGGGYLASRKSTGSGPSPTPRSSSIASIAPSPSRATPSNPPPSSAPLSVAQRKKNAYQLIKGTNRRLARAEARIGRPIAQAKIAAIDKENGGRWGLITRSKKQIKNRRDAVDVPLYRERLRHNQEARGIAETRLKSLPKTPKAKTIRGRRKA